MNSFEEISHQWAVERADWIRARALALVDRGPWPAPQNMWERHFRAYAAAHPGSLADQLVRRGDALRLERAKKN